MVCVKEGSRLRMRIATPGYVSWANCQFSRAYRKEGRSLWVPSKAVTLVQKSRKAFYRVRSDEVRVTPPDEPSLITAVYDVCLDDGLCAICYGDPRTHVAAPCGHFYACEACADVSLQRHQKCAICRTPLVCFVAHTLLE